MYVLKKINNNVAICKDENGDELIAFGKGIGFPKTPYELHDLKLISMTFYKVDSQIYRLLSEIPEEIIDISTDVIKKAQSTIINELSPNIVLSIADHINFMFTRMKYYKNLKMPLDYDIKRIYPKEYDLGCYACKLIENHFDIKVPDSEAIAIAMHLINAQRDIGYQNFDNKFDKLITEIIELIESEFDIQINQDEFSFNRFVMHLRYYLKRIEDKKVSKGDITVDMIDTFKLSYPDVYECSEKIMYLISNDLESKGTNDELFYLMIHVNRIIKKSKLERREV